MVGQITHIPGPKLLTKDDIDTLSKIDTSAGEAITLRGPIHQLFNRLRAFQRVALEGGEAEVIVQPLAIYREITLPES